MEGSFPSPCKPTTNIPCRSRADHARHTSMGLYDAHAKQQDQFCMDVVNTHTVSSIQQTLTDKPAHLSSRYECSAEDLGLLNIPSIHETMSSSFDFQGTSMKPDTSASDWECLEECSETPNSQSRSCAGTYTCEKIESNCGKTLGPAAREPLKRLRRQRANDRERRRMKSLNGALNNLKRCIPLPKTKRRVTKLEILRIACQYIQTLWETLNSGNEEQTERVIAQTVNRRSHIVNGMTVSQRLNLLSNNLKFNFQL